MGTAMVEAGALVVAAGMVRAVVLRLLPVLAGLGRCSVAGQWHSSVTAGHGSGIVVSRQGMAVSWSGMVRHGIAGMSGAVFHVAAAALLLTASAGRNQAGSCRDGGPGSVLQSHHLYGKVLSINRIIRSVYTTIRYGDKCRVYP